MLLCCNAAACSTVCPGCAAICASILDGVCQSIPAVLRQRSFPWQVPLIPTPLHDRVRWHKSQESPAHLKRQIVLQGWSCS